MLLSCQQAEGGGIFDVLSDEEDCWMPELSGMSWEESPVRALGWAARDGHEVEASRPSLKVLDSTR
jgi:hypothetical protein